MDEKQFRHAVWRGCAFSAVAALFAVPYLNFWPLVLFQTILIWLWVVIDLNFFDIANKDKPNDDR